MPGFGASRKLTREPLPCIHAYCRMRRKCCSGWELVIVPFAIAFSAFITWHDSLSASFSRSGGQREAK